MPRYSKSQPGDGWQIAEREDGIFLQRRRADGTWEDVSGPYRQRGSAMDRYRREWHRAVMANRVAGVFPTGSPSGL
jgi:hypothetical protein